MLQARRVRRLRSADLARLHVPLAKVLPFVELVDHRPGKVLDSDLLRRRLSDAAAPRQAALFDDRSDAPTLSAR